MEIRTHKLIVFAGEEGQDVEARDFKKLSQVIVNQQLSQAGQSFKNYLVDILGKAVRSIPLKAHIYAGLTASIAKNYPELSTKILQNIVSTLQTDICTGKHPQALNTLNYLSECMNISFINSLNYMNLLEDLLQASQKQTDQVVSKSILCTLVKTIILCGYSLNEKTPHQFKKFISNLHKISQDNQLCLYLYHQYSKNSLANYSAMHRLGVDFSTIGQQNNKLRLIIDLKNARENIQESTIDLYKWETQTQSEEYQRYRKGDGIILRMWLQQLLNTFGSSISLLIGKFNSLAKFKTTQPHQIRFLVESLILRALRGNNTIVEHSLLSSLRNNDELPDHSKAVEQVLFEFFSLAQTFDLSMLISYSKLFSFIASNSREEFDWSKLVQNEDMFFKRSALLQLTIQKLTLLNDKFKVITPLQPYESNKPITSQQEFNSNEREIFDKFDEELKKKTDAESIGAMIMSQKQYEIFLEALFRRTCLSHTHLTILSQRYSSILTKFSQWDWDLINKIRNFFRNSFFHRILYFRFMITNKYLSFPSYINYVGGLTNKTEIEMLWIKMELNQLNNQFGKILKNK